MKYQLNKQERIQILPEIYKENSQLRSVSLFFPQFAQIFDDLIYNAIDSFRIESKGRANKYQELTQILGAQLRVYSLAVY